MFSRSMHRLIAAASSRHFIRDLDFSPPMEVELRKASSPSKMELPLQCELALGGSIVGVWAGRVAERLMATGCKPVAPWSYGGSNPPPSNNEFCKLWFRAVVAQLVERVLGKDEVTGSSPVNGSRVSVGQ